MQPQHLERAQRAAMRLLELLQPQVVGVEPADQAELDRTGAVEGFSLSEVRAQPGIEHRRDGLNQLQDRGADVACQLDLSGHRSEHHDSFLEGEAFRG